VDALADGVMVTQRDLAAALISAAMVFSASITARFDQDGPQLPALARGAATTHRCDGPVSSAADRASPSGCSDKPSPTGPLRLVRLTFTALLIAVPSDRLVPASEFAVWCQRLQPPRSKHWPVPWCLIRSPACAPDHHWY
jgi:hypothetical protein